MPIIIKVCWRDDDVTASISSFFAYSLMTPCLVANQSFSLFLWSLGSLFSRQLNVQLHPMQSFPGNKSSIFHLFVDLFKLALTDKERIIKVKREVEGERGREREIVCVQEREAEIGVVYFDQRTGAPHAFRWSKSFFWCEKRGVYQRMLKGPCLIPWADLHFLSIITQLSDIWCYFLRYFIHF